MRRGGKRSVGNCGERIGALAPASTRTTTRCPFTSRSVTVHGWSQFQDGSVQLDVAHRSALLSGSEQSIAYTPHGPTRILKSHFPQEPE
jgi:hypothetical protein